VRIFKGEKMATPKQIRKAYRRLSRLHDALGKAIWNAKQLGLIEYATHDQSPNESMNELWTRITTTTEKKLAQTMREEIERGT
jgi:hypothetical protein